ncbi:YbjN domain-containing protein [Oceanisphaera pacifica]|uniref:YbjN domain-containing protein n=1 Tax=Oceanisphaera pacifica TaxID=2818389 RepID=A0ABS3NE57_9GAMM|nr:YbjN domain-containing protein [Oceanisphaera pacifica]MBO1518657.1 YbjN domain-containing protein [Oceanisphaera pacifica]
MRWLNAGYIEHYVCEHCHGIHFSELQALDGILESRLFVEHEGAILTSEIEIRPTALLTLMADLTRLNMNYPSLKIFVDVLDDNMPRLIVADYLHTKAGIDQAQFLWIVQHALMATQQLLLEVAELGFLMNEDEPDRPSTAVH